MNESEQASRFGEWYREYQGIVLRIARASAFNLADQEDLIQEISLQIWNSIPNFGGNCKASTWVYRVALNTAIAWGRKEKSHRETREGLAEDAHFLKETAEPRNEKLEWIYDQIRRFDPIDRSLILLHLDGQSYLEIADILGISEKNVGVKLSRLRKTLTDKANNDAI
ncbi:MAG: sigma-70 family RNA polymerase sigma factor [Verrucomicrobiae bacterium]|jgi:RNA polymerase sigma-70 factor (ECF subfamily)|nr:sigma-70 family RNA polymerase sigma factor [Verrucomicrobiae bacterium]